MPQVLSQNEFAMDAALGADLAAAVLGTGLPEAAERYLRLAACAYEDDGIAEDYLKKAQAEAPGHPAVLIGLYRFYFYKNRLVQARLVACVCLERAAMLNGISLDWQDVRTCDAAFSDFGAVLPRFYLFTLKAFAYLSMRLGDLALGRAMILKLLELDPSDKIGAKVLLGVLDRMGAGDDE